MGIGVVATALGSIVTPRLAGRASASQENASMACHNGSYAQL